jgi:hypothetical protein
MRHLLITATALALLGASAALAQGTGGTGPGAAPANPSVPPALTPDSRVIGNAPVGHRQPRAADVPSSTGSPADSAADKALDRKIKSICRGC